MNNKWNCWLLIGILSVIGCQSKVTERVYEQVVIEPVGMDSSSMANPHAGMDMTASGSVAMNPPAVNFSWTTPEEWQESAGNAMRVASFNSKSKPDSIDVSIVSLEGAAGGLVPNLVRWGTQLGIDLTGNQSQLDVLMKNAQALTTQEGVAVKIYNYQTVLASIKPESKSMLAAMLEMDGTTIFIKMTGSVSDLENNQKSFEALTASLRKK